MMGVVASGDPTATGCADWVWGVRPVRESVVPD